MPWTPKDATRHTKKARTAGAKRQWSTVAGKILADSHDEGKAIRIANTAVAKRKVRRSSSR